MANTHSTLNSLFGDIASAIRTKKGESSSKKYKADLFPQAILDIPAGGGSYTIVPFTTYNADFTAQAANPGFTADFSTEYGAMTDVKYVVFVLNSSAAGNTPVNARSDTIVLDENLDHVYSSAPVSDLDQLRRDTHSGSGVLELRWGITAPIGMKGRNVIQGFALCGSNN